jgi:DNA-damage-inducible protein D
MACSESGADPNNHFVETDKLVDTGSGAQRRVPDVFLSRYACYLIAMNGDSQKVEIARAQTYFAVKTRQQEVEENMTADERRIMLRERVRDGNRKLAGAAIDAGVRTQRMGIFQDAGYKGLYGGLGLAEIREHKGLAPKEDLLDRCGRTELAANEFRITQTEEKLKRERVNTEQRAIDTHNAVGKEVRQAIAKIGGTMPEELLPEPSIKKLESAKKRADKKTLAEKSE